MQLCCAAAPVVASENINMAAGNSAVNENGKVVLKTAAGAECEINLFGATVTKFKTASGKDLIWMSSTAKLDGTKAIRGGIPLVFPQFGQPIKEMAQHGFARNTTWRVGEIGSLFMEKGPFARFHLDNTMVTHEAWPFSYELTLEVVLTDAVLSTRYLVRNTGAEAFKFHSLQHTYLNVTDIAATTVQGFENERYLDKTTADPAALNVEMSDAKQVKGFTDRIYLCAGVETVADAILENELNPGAKTVRVKCPQGTIKVTGFANNKPADAAKPTSMPCDVVMWNPWEENAKKMGDFDNDGYLKMLCIEPGLVAGFHVLPAGGTMTLGQILSLER